MIHFRDYWHHHLTFVESIQKSAVGFVRGHMLCFRPNSLGLGIPAVQLLCHVWKEPKVVLLKGRSNQMNKPAEVCS